jgi:CDP-paratose 2-epimerase
MKNPQPRHERPERPDRKDAAEAFRKTRRGGEPVAADAPSTRGGRHAAKDIGVFEWFRAGEHERVERAIEDVRRLGIRHLRTNISWADWHTENGPAWYAWLLERLSQEVNVLPCLVYTPPSWAEQPRTSAPPRDLVAFGDFVDTVIARLGKHFEWVELWNEPNNHYWWDAQLDPHWQKFSTMIDAAARRARERGKRVVLGGMMPIDPNWLRLMGERGILAHVDAVGIHAYPSLTEQAWEGWDANIGRVRKVLKDAGSDAEIWITETGYSTWRHDERRQLTALVDAVDAAGAARVYWYSVHDREPAPNEPPEFVHDERLYHYGLKRSDGGDKLLYRIWAEGGIDGVRDAYWLGRNCHVEGRDRPVLVTGGCGFVGTNLAHRVLESGRSVILFDNLSRAGVERNMRWLRQTHGKKARIEAADVQDAHALRSAVKCASQVFHFAAQVAVTTSLVNAIHDFEVNARGTLNLLEAIRSMDTPPPLVFTSTNKVYGGLPDVLLQVTDKRYEPVDDATRAHGVSEKRPLDFHSPYGCSKGTADQYVIDYARTFGLPAVVFRMSCIYGPHQFGNEDQGWVAHFLIRARQNKPITIYGDGMQVRDVLFVEDLVDAFLLAQKHMNELSGRAFNIGGGPANTISLIQLLSLIHEMNGRKPPVRWGAWRPGDQRYYVSDTRSFQRATGWSPKVDVNEGVRRLQQWLVDADETPAGDTTSRKASLSRSDATTIATA